MTFQPIILGLMAVAALPLAVAAQPAVPVIAEQAEADRVALGGQYLIPLAAEPTPWRWETQRLSM